MKKSLFLVALMMIFSVQGFSQLISDGFESWTSGSPDGWMGSKSSIAADSVAEYTSNVHGGSSACKLINSSSSHKRFTSSDQSVNAGEYYEIKYWVRGHGDIRTNAVDAVNSIWGTYNPYYFINSSTWTELTDTVLMPGSGSVTGQFIFSLANTNSDIDHLQIDDVTITLLAITTPDVSVYEIQYTTAPSGNSPYLGQAVNTGGVVTATKNDSSAYWIQSGLGPWTGVYIFDYNNTPTIGDSITFTCQVDEYFELTELKSITNFTVVSTGNTVNTNNATPTQATTEEYESVLIFMNDVACTNANAGYGMWTVGAGADTVLIDDAIYSFSPSLGIHYDIIGIVEYSYSEWKVLPRMSSDISVHTGINESEILVSLYPNPVSSILYINADIDGNIEVYNLSGQRVFNTEFNETLSIDVSNFNSGLYNLILTDNNGTRIINRIIIL